MVRETWQFPANVLYRNTGLLLIVPVRLTAVAIPKFQFFRNAPSSLNNSAQTLRFLLNKRSNFAAQFLARVALAAQGLLSRIEGFEWLRRVSGRGFHTPTRVEALGYPIKYRREFNSARLLNVPVHDLVKLR
jgi:hypothetical protein